VFASPEVNRGGATALTMGGDGSETSIATGRCSVCGASGPFDQSDRPVREGFACRQCGASLRYRWQAQAVVDELGAAETSLTELAASGGFDNLHVYEPGIIGPFRRLLGGRHGYVNSFFTEGVRPGDLRDGVRCEDLQALTFADARFDLVISSDIFEHVRDPWMGFAEVHRVLRPGGSHIFTVPLTWPFRGTTTMRVDSSSGHDVHLVPPQYHGSPTDPRGSLVYTDFGLDLPDLLRRIGFTVTVHHGYRNVVTFVAKRPPG
jgi:SAM-dependent methyltransferase